MSGLKDVIKTSMNHDSVVYNALAWVYGAVAGKPSVRRSALIRAFKDSRFDETEIWMASGCPRKVLDAVVEKYRPRTFLDVGCGVGLAMQHVMNRGIECCGVEGSTAAIEASPVRSCIVPANLNQPIALGRKFDVVWCYEVAEHIHSKYTSTFVDVLTQHGDIVLISAAPPGQGGTGHLNEQPRSYWIELFERRNFRLQRQFSEYLQTLPDDHARNVMVFVRNGGSKVSDE